MSRARFQGRVARKTTGLGASIHGGRPTFAIKKHDREFTLFELLPTEQAMAHKQRWLDNRKVQKQVKIVDTDFIQDTEWKWDGWSAIKLAKLGETRIESMKSLLKGTLEDLEKGYTELLKPGHRTILLDEASGVRIALAFIGLEPLRRVDKHREYVRQIDRMSVEECYYWHSLCRSPSTPNGSKALRTLHVGHIG